MTARSCSLIWLATSLLLAGCTGTKGPQGPEGPEGPRGPQGAQGVEGPTGPEGPAGPAGDAGAVGAPGASVTAVGLDAGDPNCAYGGTEFVASTGVSFACNGAPGLTGPVGPAGDAGISVTSVTLQVGDSNCPNGGSAFTSASGTTYACNGNFTGKFDGPAFFDGGATFTGPTQLNGQTTVNGLDLFNAAMQGTYPAIVGNLFGSGLWCGPPPSSFTVDTVAGNSAAYGTPILTLRGEYFADESQPLPTNCGSTGSPNYCYGPITFFLNNPGAARGALFNVTLDDGPSYIYIDGNMGPNAWESNAITGNGTIVSAPIPAGPFAVSFIACSNNGPSMGISLRNQFITAYGLQVDYDRTFHRLGK